MATQKHTRRQSAAELTDAQRAHDALFQGVHGTLTLLQNALELQEYDDQKIVDCINSGGAERSAKAAMSRIREVSELLGRYEDANFPGALDIRDGLWPLYDLVALAAHALTVDAPLSGGLFTNCPAITAIQIAARDSYRLACELDKRMLEWRGTRKRAA